jgi:tetraacyldisaccharide 4'-kinase
LLREPRSSLRRASLVLLTRCDQVEEGALERIKAAIRQVVPSVPVAESIHAAEQLVGAGSKDDEALRTAELAGLNKARIVAFCGIGNPDAFRDTLMRQGAVVSAFRTFPDHHRYTRADVEDLRSWAAEQPEGTLVLTTQKDLVKIRLPDLGGRPLWALQIALRITAGQDVLDRLLKGVLSD